jgi:hypothetical protein
LRDEVSSNGREYRITGHTFKTLHGNTDYSLARTGGNSSDESP